jgi:hypothetical protein
VIPPKKKTGETKKVTSTDQGKKKIQIEESDSDSESQPVQSVPESK